MSYQSIHTGGAIDASVDTTQQILNLIYPVGAVYISVNDVNPANFIGGTWERIQDRFLVAAGDSYEAGTTGGTASHTHTTAGHILTINEMPSHKHWISGAAYDDGNMSTSGSSNSQDYGLAADAGGYSVDDPNKQYGRYSAYTGGGAVHSHGDTGVSSNLPPYLSVYMWKRTA